MKLSLKHLVSTTLFLLPPILAFLYFAKTLDFVQDDAYITYRYVANYLNGDGLVFNIGEKVEGFTNFGWTIFLIFIGALKSDYISFSKFAGTVLGAGVILVTFLTARLVFRPEDKWFAFLPPYLLGANMALAYWAQSGLETAAFAFIVALSFYFYLKRSWWLLFALTLAVWLRPEGALVAFLLILIEWIIEKRVPKFTLTSGLIAFCLSIPFVVFKYIYYGSIIPNPFFAKTGMSVEQVLDGLEYTALFLKHYGFGGAPIVLALLFWKKLNTGIRAVLLFTLCYTIYVILIGGDVLKVHRFFLPIFGFSAMLLTFTLSLLTEKITSNSRLLIFLIVSIPLIAMTHQVPEQYVYYYRDREVGLVSYMKVLANRIEETDSRNFSAAITTIGSFSYELAGHTVIDMLGLTDSTIARHPQDQIKEFETTWREQNFNATYVLTREPDYIIFSTGIKPSAPAEQALLLYKHFLTCFFSITWNLSNQTNSLESASVLAFKRSRNLDGEISPTYPPKYVTYYKKMCDLSMKGKYQAAINFCDSAIVISQRPYLNDLLVEDAFCWRELRKRDTSVALLNLALSQDSLVLRAHKFLYINAVEIGDSTQAHFHRDWIKRIAPWFWPQLESAVQSAI